ncbi:hypothetical protein U1Q18_040331 [Sarracenia purpurea var. burkii]
MGELITKRAAKKHHWRTATTGNNQNNRRQIHPPKRRHQRTKKANAISFEAKHQRKEGKKHSEITRCKSKQQGFGELLSPLEIYEVLEFVSLPGYEVLSVSCKSLSKALLMEDDEGLAVFD